MDTALGRLNDAIDFCESEKVEKIEVLLSYSDLNYLRRLIMTDEYGHSLAVDNLKRARETWKD